MSHLRPDYEFSDAERAFLDSFEDAALLPCGCNGSGYRLNANQEAVLCQCAKDRMLKAAYEEAKLPEVFFGKTIDDWNLKQDANGNDLGVNVTQKAMAKKLAQGYATALPRIARGDSLMVRHSGDAYAKVRHLLMMGNKASGKSILAAIIAQEALRKHLTVRYFTWADLYATLSSYDMKQEAKEVLEDFRFHDLLVIDGVYDYGLANKLFTFNLDRVCQAREMTGKPTIITAATDPLAMKLGPAWESLVASCFRINLPSPQPARG